jgi:hypothetical protein
MTEPEPESSPQGPGLAPRDAPADAGGMRPEDRAPVDTPTTGVRAVDAALAEIEGVEALPLEEQLAAFERAHDRLRSALDSEPGDLA